MGLHIDPFERLIYGQTLYLGHSLEAHVLNDSLNHRVADHPPFQQLCEPGDRAMLDYSLYLLVFRRLLGVDVLFYFPFDYLGASSCLLIEQSCGIERSDRGKRLYLRTLGNGSMITEGFEDSWGCRW